MKLNYKIKYLESNKFQSGGSEEITSNTIPTESNTNAVVKVVSPDESYIQILQKNKQSIDQNPPQEDVKNDPVQNKEYLDRLAKNSVKLDIPDTPLGTASERTDGDFFYKGVWVIKLGYQYKIINDNTLIEKLNRFEKAPNGMITYKGIKYQFRNGHWNIMSKGSEKYMEVPTFPIYFINFETGQKH